MTTITTDMLKFMAHTLGKSVGYTQMVFMDEFDVTIDDAPVDDTEKDTEEQEAADQDDLEQRVALAIAKDGPIMAALLTKEDLEDLIRAVIPMAQAAEREQGCEVLFALARVWEGNAVLHPGCIAAAEYMVEKAAAIRAIGAP